MIVAGESSGELYGSLLADALRARWPGLRMLGVGGQRMKESGVETFAGVTSAFGLTEALHAYRAVRETYRKTVEVLEQARPEVVVLIDYPDFNFRVAMRAKELGIKVLYYVSPQVWAWRRGRLRTMAGFVDRMALVLPFEEPIYREAGIPCEFVGHPVMEEMEKMPSDKDTAKRTLGLDPARPCLAVLPGSRRSELVRLLPVIIDVVRGFRKRHPEFEFYLPVAPNIDESDYQGHFDTLRDEGVVMGVGRAPVVFSASEAAVVASGTSTLQAVLRETPLVVIYKVFPLTFLIGKLVIKVKHVTLANLILGREAVPELLQGRANAGEVLGELEPLVSDTDRRRRMIDDLRAVRAEFEGRSPSGRVAEMAGELAGWAA